MLIRQMGKAPFFSPHEVSWGFLSHWTTPSLLTVGIKATNQWVLNSSENWPPSMFSMFSHFACIMGTQSFAWCVLPGWTQPTTQQEIFILLLKSSFSALSISRYRRTRDVFNTSVTHPPKHIWCNEFLLGFVIKKPEDRLLLLPLWQDQRPWCGVGAVPQHLLELIHLPQNVSDFSGTHRWFKTQITAVLAP